jgi:hypothetical protein
MRRRLATLFLSLAILSPVSLVVAAQPTFAASCSGTQASLTDYGSGNMTFGGSQYCSGSDVTQVSIKIHAQRCSWEWYGCKSWVDIASWGATTKEPRAITTI